VLNAIEEFDGSGQDAFLKRYGFNGAREYFLVHEGMLHLSRNDAFRRSVDRLERTWRREFRECVRD
jgi:hypothetical protein